MGTSDFFDKNAKLDYIKDGTKLLRNKLDQDSRPNECSAPSTALALKWLRDEKKVRIFVNDYFNNNSFVFHFKLELSERPLNSDTFESYEEAESAGLDYALDYLLKEKK